MNRELIRSIFSDKKLDGYIHYDEPTFKNDKTLICYNGPPPVQQGYFLAPYIPKYKNPFRKSYHMNELVRVIASGLVDRGFSTKPTSDQFNENEYVLVLWRGKIVCALSGGIEGSSDTILYLWHKSGSYQYDMVLPANYHKFFNKMKKLRLKAKKRLDCGQVTVAHEIARDVMLAYMKLPELNKNISKWYSTIKITNL